jgi:hypothetical protein|tara:strand:- start:1161 stop:1907 length:747 start_codon:yes stop_codon:yes gene_type:complete
MKLIVTHGCSFTKYKWDCWPKFIPWFGKDFIVKNAGNAASGNETIARGVVNSVMKNKNIEHMYIMWSGPDRYEVVRDTEQRLKHELATYSRWEPDFNWCVWFGGHPDQEKHKEYQKHFLNEQHNYYRTLEHILYTQMFLDKHKVEYTMMIYNKHVLKDPNDPKSNSENALHKQIDWTKFKFYKERFGLHEFAQRLYPDQFAEESDQHPLPLAHYHWVKDIIFKSDIVAPEHEYRKLKEWKILNLKEKN